ncbi:MAG: hypothetical protein CME24_00935 [Gemmatimonadetes bacterium]|nr:hypothetical protein [Gemmatimonadota bacterium]
MVKVIQKIEIFSGFDHTDVQRLLKICRFKSYAAGEDVYKRGDASDEMLLVLRGMMLVLGEDGKELARVRPGQTLWGRWDFLPDSHDQPMWWPATDRQLLCCGIRI